MSSKYETAIYTREQMDNARTKGQVIGWAQGGVTVGALMFLLQFIGWIPIVLIAGVLAFLGLKFVQRSS